ncbi:TraB/GumN family protein [Enterobacteriaceae bacterium YMB-R22]|uniref:TraB/GumN family protein n=1 Tax=Tenebrionicola larvae TaxID=2815733 RepID=UPI002012D871|nr:TraB/GumN family protein [Tenebrionicola larvae]MBV4413907.1 TraB/GumN family protein [Tenebrionicola larvae]
MGMLNRLRILVSRFFTATYPWPALDVILPGGRYLHLVGSIHMGTPDMAPLSARLLQKLQQSDALIVEADISDSGSPFPAGGSELPLHARLSAEEGRRIDRHLQALALDVGSIDNLPYWQIALMLQAQQAQRLGLRPDYGIDFQLLQSAHLRQKHVIELEGAQSQVDLLKALPDGGLTLLNDTLEHWHTNARLLQTMVSWWLESTPGIQHATLPNTFSGELYDVMMTQRNYRWRDFLRTLPPGRYVVAVGALHLYGEDSLPELLKKD